MPAGYSGTPLPRKLGIKAKMAVALIGAPEGFVDALGELPRGVRLLAGRRGACDLALWFVRSAAELRRDAVRTVRYAGDGGLWIAWPKKTSPLAADFGREEVREAGLAARVVDFKVCAVDDDWSALRFSPRR